MRLRNVKNASEILKSSSYFIENPLDYYGKISSLFSNQNPIRLEIGCGKGNFLIGMAKEFPNINFIGVEKYDSVLVRAIEKANLEQLSNLKFICVDAKNLPQIFNHDIEVIYLNFSDPWPKNRHHERRLTSTTFLTIYDTLFEGNCEIIQKTDHPVLFESSLVDFSQNGYLLDEVSLHLHQTDLFNVKTEYEEKFSNMGQPIYYLKATKKKI